MGDERHELRWFDRPDHGRGVRGCEGGDEQDPVDVALVGPAGGGQFSTSMNTISKPNLTASPAFIRPGAAAAIRDVLYGMSIILAVASLVVLRDLRAPQAA
jgi:hypothetical protein